MAGYHMLLCLEYSHTVYGISKFSTDTSKPKPRLIWSVVLDSMSLSQEELFLCRLCCHKVITVLVVNV